MTSPVLVLLFSSVLGGESIDSILAETWQTRGVEPAPLCTDDEFLRRVTLDLAGRIPTLDEIRRFRQQPDRAAKIEELLAGDEFPRCWSEIWTATLNGYANAFDSDRELLRVWIERAIRDDVPYQVADLFATVFAALGIDPAHEFQTTFGSPTQASDHGAAIAQLG
jgi:hypothetical protein